MEQPTPEYRTTFDRWLAENRYTATGFARMLAIHMNVKVFSRNTVVKWRLGKAAPHENSPYQQAVTALTGISYATMVADRDAANGTS